MNITYNLSLDERTTIHSHALSLQEYDRELLDMDFRFGLNDFRAKSNSMGRLNGEEERNFLGYILNSVLCVMQLMPIKKVYQEARSEKEHAML